MQSPFIPQHQTHMQVKLLDFHPTQPWLVYADKGQNFCVIDWSTQQAVTSPILPLQTVTSSTTQRFVMSPLPQIQHNCRKLSCVVPLRHPKAGYAGGWGT